MNCTILYRSCGLGICMLAFVTNPSAGYAGPTDDPVPRYSGVATTNNEKYIHTQIVLTENSASLAGPISVKYRYDPASIGYPPQLKIQVLDAGGNVLHKMNWWDPRQRFEYSVTSEIGAERGINRPGQDYRGFFLPAPIPDLCLTACKNEGRCQAFTYVRPGIQGNRSVCWLKYDVPARVADDCCVSGKKDINVDPAAPKAKKAIGDIYIPFYPNAHAVEIFDGKGRPGDPSQKELLLRINVRDEIKRFCQQNPSDKDCHGVDVPDRRGDLVVDDFATKPNIFKSNKALKPGQDIHNIKILIKNRGAKSVSDAYAVDVVLSVDAHADVELAIRSDAFVDDVLLKGGRIESAPRLGPGDEEAVYKERLGLPDVLEKDKHYVCVVVDAADEVVESDETNNVKCSEIVIETEETCSMRDGPKYEGPTPDAADYEC